jgi:hypothetical protein
MEGQKCQQMAFTWSILRFEKAIFIYEKGSILTSNRCIFLLYE